MCVFVCRCVCIYACVHIQFKIVVFIVPVFACGVFCLVYCLHLTFVPVVEPATNGTTGGCVFAGVRSVSVCLVWVVHFTIRFSSCGSIPSQSFRMFVGKCFDSRYLLL